VKIIWFTGRKFLARKPCFAWNELKCMRCYYCINKCSVTCPKVLGKSRGRGHENEGSWVHTSYSILHGVQSHVTKRHVPTTAQKRKLVRKLVSVFQDNAQHILITSKYVYLYLKINGFRVKLYRCYNPYIVHSKLQIIFMHRDAKKKNNLSAISRMNLTDIKALLLFTYWHSG
jgi:hypothetical protein